MIPVKVKKIFLAQYIVYLYQTLKFPLTLKATETSLKNLKLGKMLMLTMYLCPHSFLNLLLKDRRFFIVRQCY